MDWVIYYGDETTYTSEDGSVFDAPSLNVQAVSCRTDDPNNSRGFYPVFRFDYYWWEDPDWFGGDLFGLYDYLSRPGPKKVIFGRTISNEKHQEIVNLACNDERLLRKSNR